MGFKVKIRVIHPQGRREKYSFQLREGELFPLGSHTEGLMHGHRELSPEQACILVREGQVIFRSGDAEGELRPGSRREVGPFRLEVLETAPLEPTATDGTSPAPDAAADGVDATRVATAVPESLHVPGGLTLSGNDPGTGSGTGTDTASAGESTTFSNASSGLRSLPPEPAGETRFTLSVDRGTAVSVERPELPRAAESTRTAMQYQERFEKTSATAMIQRSRERDDRITRYSLMAAAAVLIVAVPVYLQWIPLGWFRGGGDEAAVAAFPGAADTWSKASEVAPAARAPETIIATAPPTGPARPAAPTEPAVETVTAAAPPASAVAAAPVQSPAARPADAFLLQEAHDAAQAGQVAVLTRLLDERRYPVNEFSPEGRTLLMTAAAAGKAEVIQFLVSRGASVNATDRLGTTALMWAAMKGHFKAVTALVEAGAEPGMARADGDTATAIAERWGHRRMARFLADPRGFRRAEERAVAAAAAKKAKAAATAAVRGRESARKPASSKAAPRPKGERPPTRVRR